jgi:alkylated DNA nucleotide flippase Atl1
MNIYQQAQRMWPILACLAKEGELITYGDLALKMGYTNSRAGRILYRPLGIIGQYCVKRDLPALNVLAVNARTKRPGSGVVFRSGHSIDEEREKVFKKQWGPCPKLERSNKNAR